MNRFDLRFPVSAFLVGLLAVLTPSSANAEVSIGQVDASALLTSQIADVYVSVAGPDGVPISGLGPEGFSLSEGSSEESLLPVREFEFHEGAGAADGITFYLLVDNSGSMYERMDDGESRIAAVGRAVSSFLASVDNPRDHIGLGSFNTNYVEGTAPTPVRAWVEAAFARIERPDREASYTELYAALTDAARFLEGRRGRKVVILLSDGENYPYSTNSGKPHPLYGSVLATSAGAIDAMVREGISVFPVHFGPARKDAALRRIAAGTGGRVFDARDGAELAEAYREIRRRVLGEYRIRYRPRMMSGDRRLVRVSYRGDAGTETDSRQFFTGTIFGRADGPYSLLFLIPLLLAPALWFALTRLRLLNVRSSASLEVLEGGSTQIFALSEGKTVIGDIGGTLTIAQADGKTVPGPGMVTVVKDERTGTFTIASPKPVYVNNRPTEHRRLAPGDVIRIGDATIVFDEPTTQKP